MSPKFSFIKVDLKNAHNIIVRKHQIQEKKYKKYLKGLLSWSKPKIKFNSNLFIKSLMSNLENRKINFLLDENNKLSKKLKLNAIHVNKSEFKNNNKNKFPELRKSQSCKELYDEKSSLINNNIKSNNKFNSEFQDEIYKTQDMNDSTIFNNDFKKENINFNLSKSLKIFNQNRNNNPLKIQKNGRAFVNFSNKYLFNKRSKSSKVMKVSQGSQSTIDFNLGKNNLDNTNKLKIKQNRNFNNRYQKQIEYLKFLEKKSLSLRANFIVNNIQENRGGKQELRASYNPLDK